MPTLKVHLEQAECDAVERFAAELSVKPEALLYTALNRLMLDCRNPAVGDEIRDTWDAHRHSLPLWSDSACSPHAYEGKGDDEPEPSRMMQ